MGAENSKFQLYQHPWLAMVLEHLVGIFTLLVVIVGANTAGIPGDAPYRPLITPTLAHLLVLFLVVPFILKLPSGKQSFKEYLAEIRLTNLKPFLPLLGLGLSCSLLALFALSSQSLLFRIWQGLPITASFLGGMIPIKSDLPPSLGYIIAFPSIFEEISWRGVMLVLFRRKYSARTSVMITALGFGLLHLVNLLFDVPANFVLRQVIMGVGFGLFYGYLVLRTDSLFPAMLFHYVVNMFIGSFTHYAQSQASDPALVVLLLINIPLTTAGLMLWVRFFSNKWLPRGQGSVLSWMEIVAVKERRVVKTESRTCYLAAAVIILVGIAFTAGIFWLSEIRMIPSNLADIYREEQHSLTVPGFVDLRLNRVGAYGIYYHYSLVTSAWEEVEIPPEIECSLVSETGKTSLGVLDYVPSNRFWEKYDGGPAVLIQSISVDEPGEYRFLCQYPEGVAGPSFQISLGPNYVWEMIRMVLKNGLALLLLIFSLPTAISVSGILLMAGLIASKGTNSKSI